LKTDPNLVVDISTPQAVTTEELIFMKAELQRQIGTLKQKVESIDRVLELLAENGLTAARTGRYTNMSVANAIVDFLSRTPGEFMHVAGTAAALKRGGIKSKSPNFTTIVSSTCNRLATGKKQKLVLGKKARPKTFAVLKRLDRKG
jgi:hypothetical protein